LVGSGKGRDGRGVWRRLFWGDGKAWGDPVVASASQALALGRNPAGIPGGGGEWGVVGRVGYVRGEQRRDFDSDSEGARSG